MKANINIEYQNRKVDTKDLEKKVKEIWQKDGKKVKDMRELDLYYKPEENTCYYVVNGTETGSFQAESK